MTPFNYCCGLLEKVGLGEAAKLNVGAIAGTVAAGDDPRILNAITTSSPAACTAWVVFGGGGGATIRASYNVSSVSYVGNGVYQINFTTPMSSANYAYSINGTQPDQASNSTSIGVMIPNGSSTPSKTASQITVLNQGSNGLNTDISEASVTIFGGK